ncbi:alpha/beta fold hydrolase [Marinicella litoralis]|uniref:Pimeloyl-ACP methyl ester carboxylesterase n=1 Tax=Marinicella litoralis TaxID=644220 RepID=A0A4R6XTC3_9GAMM|nr:alpha/beta hydrolase [Marinicella litoralis]TDR20683.1 pimeloyl-ACP methyl ester carboxylesterase [Marinicella litoralis]
MNNIVKYVLVYMLFSTSNVLAGSFSFNSDGVNIHYNEVGDGVPVILIHGYTMNSGMWNDTILYKTLSKKHRIITLDLRGHGLSDKPLKPREYGPKVGEDVIKLMEHLKIKKAHLVGYSMGAYVVGRLAVTHPERILSATLVSGFFPFSDTDEDEYSEQTARHMEAEAGVEGSEDKESIYALAAVARGWKYDAVTDEQVAKVNLPMQAIFGSQEQNDMFKSQKYRFSLPSPSVTLVVIEGADHDSNNAAVLSKKFTKSVEELILKSAL